MIRFFINTKEENKKKNKKNLRFMIKEFKIKICENKNKCKSSYIEIKKK